MFKEYEFLTWAQFVQARDANELFVLAAGAIEQHGSHLPLSVDQIIPYEIIKQRISPHIDLVLLPRFYYGYRSQTVIGGGPSFPGTLRMSAESVIYTIRDIILELLRHGVKKLLITDGHLENKFFIIEGIERALQEYHGNNKIKVMYSEWNDYVKPETLDKVFDGKFPGFEYEHAAVNETSLMLALRPDLINSMDFPNEFAQRYINYSVWPDSPDLVTRNGALSSAQNSSAENGELMLSDIVEGMLRDIEIEFSSVK